MSASEKPVPAAPHAWESPSLGRDEYTLAADRAIFELRREECGKRGYHRKRPRGTGTFTQSETICLDCGEDLDA